MAEWRIMQMLRIVVLLLVFSSVLHAAEYAAIFTGPGVSALPDATADGQHVTFLWVEGSTWGLGTFDPAASSIYGTRSAGEGTAISIDVRGNDSYRVFTASPPGFSDVDRAGGRTIRHELKGAAYTTLLAGDTAPDGAVYAIIRSHPETGIVRLNRKLELEWAYTFSSPETAQLSGVAALPDGGFIATGRLAKQGWILRGTSSGEILWETRIGGQGFLEARSILPTRDGFLVEVTTGVTSGNVSIASLDRDGGVRWYRSMIIHDGIQLHDILVDDSERIHLLARTFHHAGAQIWRMIMSPEGAGLHAESFAVHGVANHNAFAGTAEHPVIALLQGIERKTMVVASLGGDGKPQGCNLTQDQEFYAFESDALVARVETPKREMIMTISGSEESKLSEREWQLNGSCELSIAAFTPPRDFPRGRAPLRSGAPTQVRPALPITYVDSMKEEDFMTLVRDQFRKRRFASLEELASNLRENRVREAGWGWRLWDFYAALTPENFPDLGWQGYLEALREWQAILPNAQSPKVLEIQGHIDLAWQARGTRYADRVPEGGWESFREHLSTAIRKAEGFDDGSITDPHFYTQWINAAEYLGQPNRQVLEKALDLEPEYFYAVSAAAFTDDPKWGGSVQDHADLIRWSVERAGPTGGEQILVRQVPVVAYLSDDVEEFLSYGFEWEELETAYRNVLERFPESGLTRQRFASLACIYQKRDVARELFEHPALEHEMEAAGPWEIMPYATCAAWARTPSPPQRTAAAAPLPSLPKHEGADDAPAKWMRTFVGQWPRLTLENRVEISSGTIIDDFLAFAITDGARTFVVTSPHGLDELWHPDKVDTTTAPVLPRTAIQQSVRTWTLEAPAGTVPVLGIEPQQSSHHQAIVLNVESLPVDVAVLELRPEPPETMETYYVVGCRPTSEACAQEVVTWSPQNEMIQKVSGRWRMSVLPPEASALRLIGAPVIDLRGRAVGVVVENILQPDGTISYYWEELTSATGTP